MAGWKVYVCSKCGYEFDEKREREEFDEKNFQCPKCGKAGRYFEEVTDED